VALEKQANDYKLLAAVWISARFLFYPLLESWHCQGVHHKLLW